jgi:hypothetical protein
MSLDPSIILGYRAPQFENPVQQYGNVLAIQNAGNQNRLADLQYRQALKTEAEGDALKAALSAAGGDEAQVVNALYRAGRVKEANDFLKSGLDRQNLKSQIDERDLKMKAQKLEALSGLIAPLAQKPDLTHEDVFAAGRQAQALGLVPAGWEREIPMNAMQLPAYVRQLALSTEQGRKSLEMVLPKPTFQDIAGPNGAPVTAAFNTNPLAGPIGQMDAPTVAKPVKLESRDRGGYSEMVNPYTNVVQGGQLAKTMTPGEIAADRRAGLTYDAERGVVVNTRAGTATPVMAGGQPLGAKLPESAKKELQGIDAQANTVQQALQSVKSNPGAFGFTRGAATMAGSVPEVLANKMSSDENIQARSFVFNVVSKVINERAGAAQSAQELARLRSFLPAEMDDAAVIESKLKGFEKYLSEQRKAYEVAPQAKSPTAPAPQAPLPPRSGEVVDGYKFKGGNPADRNNWVKVSP